MFLRYWNYSIQQIDGISPPLLKLLNEQMPEVNGNKLTISVRNETEGMALKKEIWISLLLNIYQSFGFPMLTIETEIQRLRKK